MIGVLYAVLFVLIADVKTQDTQRRNLLFVNRHEPTKDGTLQTKTQQTVVVSPEVVISKRPSGKHSPADINTPKHPSPFGSAFLPVGFLSNPSSNNAIGPTVISPISTTRSGFNGITQSINSLIASVNKHTTLLTKSIQTDLQRQTNALTGLIKASAEKKMNSALSDVFGGFQGERNDKTIPVTNSLFGGFQGERNDKTIPVTNLLSLSNTNIQPFNNRQQNVNQIGNLGRRIPLVLRNSNDLVQQSQFVRSPPRPESFRPIVVSREPALTVSRSREPALTASRFRELALIGSRSRDPALTAARPLVLAPRRFSSNQRNTDNRSRTRQAMDTTDTRSRTRKPIDTTNTRTRIPLNPSRPRSETRLQQLQPRRQPTVTRNRLAQLQVTRQQIARGQNTPIQRQRAQTRPVTRQMVQTQQSRRCPSQDDCRPIVPATCRRTSYITDDNGRRLCRGCDEDSCAFAGFETRWGHGFG
ncbi:Hypothetical predicted protein [Mytilus galloprovincialis]|uniref:Uncharacterized protein n=1 Tax=Mytilus galloprovincialis TaxID=29158 RepID=A0A8B6GWE3_MYTGA|nr:Hypothetical predicted protein [Mytilus galloprovincialis]